MDVLPQFVQVYNEAVHSIIGMTPSKVTDTDYLRYGRK